MTYISEQELNTIKGLMHYLNENVPTNEGVDVIAHVMDTDGGLIGTITKPNSAQVGAGYVFEFVGEGDES